MIRDVRRELPEITQLRRLGHDERTDDHQRDEADPRGSGDPFHTVASHAIPPPALTTRARPSVWAAITSPRMAHTLHARRDRCVRDDQILRKIAPGDERVGLSSSLRVSDP